jgi:PAS domain-containing protein
MTGEAEGAEQVDGLHATPNLADALESEQFRRFLDQVPIAIVVAEMKVDERFVYANPEFEKLSGQTATEVEGKGPVAGLVGIEGGVVSGVSNLESPGVRAPGWRPRHDKRYHEA